MKRFFQEQLPSRFGFGRLERPKHNCQRCEEELIELRRQVRRIYVIINELRSDLDSFGFETPRGGGSTPSFPPDVLVPEEVPAPVRREEAGTLPANFGGARPRVPEEVPAPVRREEALPGAGTLPANFGGARPRVPAEFYVPEFLPLPPTRRRRRGTSIVIF